MHGNLEALLVKAGQICVQGKVHVDAVIVLQKLPVLLQDALQLVKVLQHPTCLPLSDPQAFGGWLCRGPSKWVLK